MDDELRLLARGGWLWQVRHKNVAVAVELNLAQAMFTSGDHVRGLKQNHTIVIRTQQRRLWIGSGKGSWWHAGEVQLRPSLFREPGIGDL